MSVLLKKTSYPHSISLTQEEFDDLSVMKYESIEVRSTTGKFMTALPCHYYSKLLPLARLLLVKDDPDQKHYWVLNFQ